MPGGSDRRGRHERCRPPSRPLAPRPSRRGAWWRGQEVALCGHALAETCSILTRLPGDARLAPLDAVRLINARFSPPLLLSDAVARDIPNTLSRLGIAGGAVYDALVALAAREHDATLATRDARARGTDDALGVDLILIPA